MRTSKHLFAKVNPGSKRKRRNPLQSARHGLSLLQKKKRLPFPLVQRAGAESRLPGPAKAPVTFVIHRASDGLDTKVITMLCSYPQIA